MSSIKSSDVVAGLQDAIRENPVSAALIGMGVMWMFTGGAKMSTATALLTPAARAAASSVGNGLQASADAAGTMSDGVRSLGSSVADGVRNIVSGAAASAGATAAEAYDAAKGAASDSVSNITKAADRLARPDGSLSALQGNLKATFERQPLLLGAIGLALGAVMASAMPRTQIEAELVSETAERVTTQVKEFASEQVDRASETAKRTLKAVKEEASAQGLTAEAAMSGATAISEKLKTVAKAARGKSSPSNQS